MGQLLLLVVSFTWTKGDVVCLCFLFYFIKIKAVSRQRSIEEALGSDNNDYNPSLEFSPRAYPFESEAWGKVSLCHCFRDIWIIEEGC